MLIWRSLPAENIVAALRRLTKSRCDAPKDKIADPVHTSTTNVTPKKTGPKKVV